MVAAIFGTNAVSERESEADLCVYCPSILGFNNSCNDICKVKLPIFKMLL